MNELKTRTEKTTDGALKRNPWRRLPKGGKIAVIVVGILAVLAVLLAALFVASIRDKQQLVRALPLLLCTLMTPAWFIVLRTHSIQHGWFTWRALGLTVFAGLAFLYYCCDVRQIAKRLKRT